MDPRYFREAAGPEAKRQVDQRNRAPFAPTNLRMFRQTWLGLCALGETNAVFPPWQPAEEGRLAVVEVLPAQVARALGGGTYKGRDAVAARAALLDAAKHRCGLQVPEELERQILADAEGDALDAVFAALAAASAWATGFRAPSSPEGFIFGLV